MPITQDAQSKPYDTYGQIIRRIWDTGVTLLPLAQSFDSSSPQTAPPHPVVQLNSPTGFIILEFDATRKGDWPVVPSPALNSSVQGIIFKNGEVAEFAPPLTEDGQTKLYKVMGRYVYLPQVPPWLAADSKAGKVPYDDQPAAANVMPAVKFDPSLNPLNQ